LIKKNERLLTYEKNLNPLLFKNDLMKHEFTESNHNSTQSHIALYLMVNRISQGSLPVATQRHSFIVNDVPADLVVNTDEHMLAAVFGSLLNTVISHTENSCIRVSAKLYGKVVIVNLKETHQLTTFSLVLNLRQVQQLAEKIGGSISISGDHTRPTTIVFSFVNNLTQAA
jgi:hypothetical protein